MTTRRVNYLKWVSAIRVLEVVFALMKLRLKIINVQEHFSFESNL